MKRFRFRLEPLVTVRSLNEQQAREQFVDAHHRHLATMDALSAARDALEEALAQAQTERLVRLEAGQCVRLLTDVRLHDEALAAASETCEAAANALEQARLAWLETRRDLKIVERLRENAREEHARTVLHDEQQSLDELAVLCGSRSPLT